MRGISAWKMVCMILRLIATLVYLLHDSFQCNFPAALIGDWFSADRGNITFENSSYIASYKTVNTVLPASLNFTCYEQQENVYLLKSTTEIIHFGEAVIKLYLCIELFMVDDNVGYYYQLTENDPFLLDNIHGQVPEVNMSEACSRTKYTRSFITLVKTEAAEDGFLAIQCPDALLATFSNVTIQRHGVSTAYNCPGTVFDVCMETNLIEITYGGMCARTEDAQTLSDSGRYLCIHSITDGSNTFLAVWNTDVGVINPINCFALQRTNDTVYMTESPGFCGNNSSPFTTETGNAGLILAGITESCENTTIDTGNGTNSGEQNAEQSSNAALWSLIVLPVAILIAVALSYLLITRKLNGMKEHNDFDFFGSGTIHVDNAGKPTFDPSVIQYAKNYNFKPKRTLSLFSPIFDTKWIPKYSYRLKPSPKIAPLYSDVFDD